MLLTAVGLCVAFAGCTEGIDDPDEPTPSASATAAGRTAKLSFGVWGAPAEVSAYESVVTRYNAEHREVKVKLDSFADRETLRAALDSGDVPDVFLIGRGELADLRDRKINQPIGDLLDERDVDFGDGYSRPALEAFSAERELQCMPYGVSPMVIYYNTGLIDFPAMAARDLLVPPYDDPRFDADPTWNLEQFRAAAQYAARPRKQVAGFNVAPTLRGLAPFIYSAGGDLFNDADPPTSLAFSSDDTLNALGESVLPLLRNPRLGLSPEMLAQKSALDAFKEGELGMIADFRSLTPELRDVPGLSFDVMPMPVIDDAATVGDLTGICIARGTPDVAEAADFLVDLISGDSVTSVTDDGYLVPANVAVALSDAFLQPDRMPAHAVVFTASIKDMRIPPLLDHYAELEAAVAAPLDALLRVELPDLDELTAQIDLASQSVLATEQDSQATAGDEE